LVTGSNSLWTSFALILRGLFAGDSNSLIISDGGAVQLAGNLSFGDQGAGVNSLLVTGPNSRLAIGGFLFMNSATVTGNSLVISNGGTVSVGLESQIGLIGSETVLVTGANSLWTNSGALVVGASGSGHSFTVANGGTVAASSITLAQDADSSATLNIGALGGNDTAGTVIAPTIAFGAGTGAINFNQANATTINSMSRLDYDIARSSWVGDYPVPNTFLDMFVTGGGNNRTGWSNPAYDKLIADAASETDPQRRHEILREAEKLLVCEQMPVCPLYFYVGIQLYDADKLGGIAGNVLDEHPLKAMFWKGGRK
jgi:T5SS/PEP-CTERM-associated repeat protein